MGGLAVFQTEARSEVVDFYRERVGAEVWLEQPGRTILGFDGFRFGFVDRAPAEVEGTLTFIRPHRSGVDQLHDALADVATSAPTRTRTQAVYRFYARDPEGRSLAVQTFL